MNLIKLALTSAAAVFAFKYATKKRPEDGKSLVDDISDRAPEVMDKVKGFTQQVKDKYKSATENY